MLTEVLQIRLILCLSDLGRQHRFVRDPRYADQVASHIHNGFASLGWEPESGLVVGPVAYDEARIGVLHTHDAVVSLVERILECLPLHVLRLSWPLLKLFLLFLEQETCALHIRLCHVWLLG